MSVEDKKNPLIVLIKAQEKTKIPQHSAFEYNTTGRIKFSG